MRAPANPRNVRTSKGAETHVTRPGCGSIGFQRSRRGSCDRLSDRRVEAGVKPARKRTGAGAVVPMLIDAGGMEFGNETPAGSRRGFNAATATERTFERAYIRRRRPLICDTVETIKPAATKKGAVPRLGVWNWPRMERGKSNIPDADQGLFVKAGSQLWEKTDKKTDDFLGKTLPKYTAVARLTPYNTVTWTECLRCAWIKNKWNSKHEQMLRNIMTKLVDENLAVDGTTPNKKEVQEAIIKKANEFIDTKAVDERATQDGWTEEERKKGFERVETVRSLVRNSFCCTNCDKNIPKNERLPFHNNITWYANDKQTESVMEVMDVFHRKHGKVEYGLKPKMPSRNSLWQSANEASEGFEPNAIWVEEKKTKESLKGPRVLAMLLVLTKDVQQGQEIYVESYGDNYAREYCTSGSGAYGIAADNKMAIWRNGQFSEITTITNKHCSYPDKAENRLKKFMQQDCKIQKVAPAQVNESIRAEDIAQAAHTDLTLA